MKCSKCGGEINLTDEVCPHCGMVITQTSGHRSDLKTYTEKTEKSKRRLAKVHEGNVPLVISAVVMVALFVAICIASYVSENAYSFRPDAMRNESVKKSDEYRAVIQKYLEAGDYTGFAAFKEYHNIAEWEAPYDDLNLLWEIADEYNGLVSEVESSIMFGPEADRYRPEQDVADCRRAIYDFYYEYDYKQSEIESDPYAKYMHDMKKKADILLDVYLGMDDEKREAYLASSDIEQEAYLEGVIVSE